MGAETTDVVLGFIYLAFFAVVIVGIGLIGALWRGNIIDAEVDTEALLSGQPQRKRTTVKAAGLWRRRTDPLQRRSSVRNSPRVLVTWGLQPFLGSLPNRPGELPSPSRPRDHIVGPHRVLFDRSMVVPLSGRKQMS